MVGAVVSLIRRGANPNAADDSGNSAVHYACAFGWEECLSLLQAAGAVITGVEVRAAVPGGPDRS